MQKINTTLLILILFIPLILNGAKATHLDYWVLFSGGDARPMKLMVDKFNFKHPHINVKMKVIRWSEYYETLDISIKKDEVPSIAIVHASLLEKYIKLNVLLNLDNQEIHWDNFSKNLLSYIKYENSNYALPLDTHPQLLYFNKRYLKKVGLLNENEMPIINEGASGFIEFFKILKEGLPEGVRPLSSANVNVYPFWIWYSLYMQQNLNQGYISKDKANFNNEAGKKALDVLKQMREAGVWKEKIHDEKGYNLFKFNKAATMITGSWATWNFSQNYYLNYGVTTFPKLFDEEASFGDGHTFVVFKNEDKQREDDSIVFIKWMSDNSYEWALSGQVPANK